MRTEDQLARALGSLLGPGQISQQEPVLSRFSRDALTPGRALPGFPELASRALIVVRPHSTDDVVQVVTFAHHERVPIVPYGGGTGLMGGALTVQPGIVLDLGEMNRVLEVRPDDRTATAQAGVVLKDLGQELNKHGLILGHDPWTVSIATVGGAIATNGVGYRGGRYGSMGDQVLGLEVVLPAGEVLRTRAVPRSSTGIGLRHLFIGAEGAFGIITTATLHVFPKPEARALHAFSFADFPAGFQAILALFRLGLKPSLLDYGGDEGDDPRAILYLGFEGFVEEVAASEGRALALCHAHGGQALPGVEAQRFWDQRHVVAERFAERRAGGQDGARWYGRDEVWDYVHVAVPASRVLEYWQRCRDILPRYGVYAREYGLWNQPELFSISMARRGAGPEDIAALAGAVDEVLMVAQDLGGSMEYVHGVGVRLAHLMGREHGQGLEVLRALKQTLDPHHIMNPGKLGL